jgi:hypothetical protein
VEAQEDGATRLGLLLAPAVLNPVCWRVLMEAYLDALERLCGEDASGPEGLPGLRRREGAPRPAATEE